MNEVSDIINVVNFNNSSTVLDKELNVLFWNMRSYTDNIVFLKNTLINTESLFVFCLKLGLVSI